MGKRTRDKVATPGKGGRLTRRDLLKVAGAAAMTGAVGTWPTRVFGAPAVVVKRGGTLNWAEVNDPISFDPHNRANASATVMQRLVYQCFTRHNPRTMAVEPALATKWEYTKPTELVWTLRQGVTFHNGQPFTAEDAKWNVDRALDPKTGSPFAAWYSAVEKTEVLGRLALKMTLNRPDPVLPGKFGAMRVVGFAPGGSDPRALASNPIGTGPYRMTEWVPNDRCTFVRNERYWERGVPYIDTMSVKFITQEDTRIAGLRAGAVDFSIVSADGARRLQGSSNLKFIKGVHGVFTVIKMHQRFAPFRDRRVRKAMDLAIDRKEIIEKALGGSGVPIGPIVSGWEDYGIAPDRLPYKVDLDQARKLMAEAGYSSGFEVTAVSLPEGHPAAFYPTIATAADQWRRIGVNVRILQLELGAWLQRNNTLDYDMLVGNRGFRGDPIDVLQPHYHPKGSDNPLGYSNSQVQRWIDQAAVEPDRLKRREMYLNVQKKVLEDVPWILLWAPVENYAMQRYVMGYDHVPFDSFKDLMWTTWLDK
jgi:peptide/nickel transport system substrate-binding protein